MDELTFDITWQSVPVTIGGEKYRLKEPSGDAVIKYRNASIQATKFGEAGKPTGFGNIADVEPLLVSLCLFKVGAANEDIPVDLKVIRAWPYHVQKGLYEKAKELGGMDDKKPTALELRKQVAKLQEEIKALEEESDPKGPQSNTRDG